MSRTGTPAGTAAVTNRRPSLRVPFWPCTKIAMVENDPGPEGKYQAGRPPTETSSLAMRNPCGGSSTHTARSSAARWRTAGAAPCRILRARVTVPSALRLAGPTMPVPPSHASP